MLDDALKTRIDNEIASESVVLFMKGTPVFPQCGFSAAVVGVLSHLGVKFRGINVLEDDSIREGIKAYSDWPTIPQLYVKGEFVGGCDIIREMYESGELTEMFQTHGIDARQARQWDHASCSSSLFSTILLAIKLRSDTTSATRIRYQS